MNNKAHRGVASFCQIMTKGGSFLIRMGVAYICLYKFVYIKLSERGVLQNPPGYAPGTVGWGQEAHTACEFCMHVPRDPTPMASALIIIHTAHVHTVHAITNFICKAQNCAA